MELVEDINPYAKFYVDPSIYNDIFKAVERFAVEVDTTLLTIGDLLGSGEFGKVYRGTLHLTEKSLLVAVKKLRVNRNYDSDKVHKITSRCNLFLKS